MKKAFILLLLIQCSALIPQNSEELVEEKLDIVLQELDSVNREIGDLPPFLKSLIEFLLQMNIIFRIIFILLLAVFFIFTIYKVYQLFMREKTYKSSSIFDKAPGGNDQINQVDYFKSALERSHNREYGQAIIFLHRGSVHNLFNKRILSGGRDYTNREIVNVISDERTSDGFYQIARIAELISFKGKKANKNDFIEMEQLYRRFFL